MNESLKNSLERPNNVVEEKRKNGQAKNLHKKDQHVYNNYYELRSGAINYIRHLQLVFFLLQLATPLITFSTSYTKMLTQEIAQHAE